MMVLPRAARLADMDLAVAVEEFRPFAGDRFGEEEGFRVRTVLRVDRGGRGALPLVRGSAVFLDVFFLGRDGIDYLSREGLGF